MAKVEELVIPLQKKITSLTDELRQVRSEIKEYDKNLFLSNGGCTTCDGRGWIVTWDTLDCMNGSYADYSECTNTNCTPDTRKASGMLPRRNKYDRNRGTRVEDRGSADQVKQKDSLLNKIAEAEIKIRQAREDWTPGVNKLVKITSTGAGPRSHQNEVGAIGLVIKKFCNKWGTEKLIIIDESGKKHWPSVKKVEVVDPNPDVSKYNEVLDGERKKNGLPVVVTIKAKSSKAALVLTTTNKEAWVPISQAPELKNCMKGDTLSAVLPMWLIKKNSLI